MIITAKRAREITNTYIPYDYDYFIGYIMEKIEDTAEGGATALN